MEKEYINKIIEIGKKESCTPQELNYFLKNLPDVGNRELRDTLRRGYKINTGHIGRREFLTLEYKNKKQPLSDAQKKTISFLTDFIKGCHLIEIKHGSFGSTTNTYNLLGSLIEIDVNKAIDLYNWIASNGGNYYIESGVTYKESRKREQEAEKNRIKKLINDQKIHSKAVIRKERMRDLHNKKSEEARKRYKEWERDLQKMDDKQLIKMFNGFVGNPSWAISSHVNSRARFLSMRARFRAALPGEFKSRGLDFSVIRNKNGVSFAKKIKLVNEKIFIDI